MKYLKYLITEIFAIFAIFTLYESIRAPANFEAPRSSSSGPRRRTPHHRAQARVLTAGTCIERLLLPRKALPPRRRTAGDRRRSLAGLPRAGTVPPGPAEVPANAQPERRTLIARSQGGPPPPHLGSQGPGPPPPPQATLPAKVPGGVGRWACPSGRGSKVGWQGGTFKVHLTKVPSQGTLVRWYVAI